MKNKNRVRVYPVQTRLDEENLLLLKSLSKELGVSLSLMARLIIIGYLKRNNGGNYELPEQFSKN
ncbi:MAG: hypothetical protein HPY57_02245 [Ignavibacteria bacterium]|nr:hypothetical protein [Ignavibacteria bacterium]